MPSLMSGGFLRTESSLLFERVFALYSTIVLSLYRWRKIDFKMTIIWHIGIISGIRYRPTNVVVVTGLYSRRHVITGRKTSASLTEISRPCCAAWLHGGRVFVLFPQCTRSYIKAISATILPDVFLSFFFFPFVGESTRSQFLWWRGENGVSRFIIVH